MTRRCLAAIVLLVASLAPGLALGASSRISPLASPVPVAKPLDLAAMALTPLDLEDVGLTGFGQQSSAFLDLDEQVEQRELEPARTEAVGPDIDADQLRAALSAAGFQQ